MSRKITIEPVTRIEGHAKVVVHLNDARQVEQAVLHVNEFRGFEKFCEGRMFYEMPLRSPSGSAASAPSATTWSRSRPATRSSASTARGPRSCCAN